MSWSEKFLDEVGSGDPWCVVQIPRFSPDSSRKPPLLIHCGRGFARITFHSKTTNKVLLKISLEDILVFWRSGAYKKYPRSYGADHRVCGDHCPTSGHSGPRTPVNDLKVAPGPVGILAYSVTV